MARQIIGIIENTHTGWLQAFDLYNQGDQEAEKKTEIVEFIFQVLIENDISKDANDVTNLRFFMPIVQEIENHKNYIWRLEVLFPKDEESNKNDIGRAYAFLCLMFKYVDIVKDAVYAFGEKGFFEYPMQELEEGINRAKENGKLAAFKEQELEELKGVLRKTYIRKYKNPNLFVFAYPWKDLSDAEKAALQGNENEIRKEIESREFQTHKRIRALQQSVFEKPMQGALYVTYNEKIGTSNIFPCLCFVPELGSNSREILYTNLDQKYEKGNGSFGVLSNIIEALEEYLADKDKYIGIDNIKLEKDQKQALVKELKGKIRSYAEEINALTYMILLYVLRNLLAQKQLLKAVDEKNIINGKKKNPGEIEKIKRLHIDETILHKAVADAASYAESIYQIIENSCMHSYGRKAYFGMRIHNVSRHATMTHYEKESKMLIRLYNKYSDCLELNANGQVIGDKHEFNNATYDDFLEFFVVDNASNQEGILSHYNQRNAETVDCIDEILDKPLKELDDYIQHYGLRWFKKIVKKNHGHFIVKSPYKKADGSYENSCWRDNGENSYSGRSKNKQSVDRSQAGEIRYTTDYTILVPLAYKTPRETLFKQMPPTVSVNKIFGNTVHIEDYRLETFHCMQAISALAQRGVKVGVRRKEDVVKEIIKQLPKNLPKDTVFLWDATNCAYSDIELLAKSLFGYIYRNDAEVRQYFAVDFGRNKEFITEFVRIFSVFYDKDEINHILKNVQIALCADNLEYEKAGCGKSVKEVGFILAGKNLRSVYATANVFLYYNTGNTLSFIPLLNYLISTPKESENKKNQEKFEPVEQFPFDLFLSKDTKNRELKAWQDSWFLDKMQNVLNTDMERKELYGCKFDNVHVRLHSGVHIDCFYEAELLFHNIGNIYRFAYLLARDIIKDLRARYCDGHYNNVIVCSYENYSSVLLQQVCEILKDTLEQSPAEIRAYVGVAKENNEIIMEECYRKTFGAENVGNDCYTILPISTTLSSVYKMHRAMSAYMEKHQESKPKFCKNYSLIVVGDRRLKEGRELKETEPIKHYWQELDETEKKITLTPYQYTKGVKTKERTEVDYLLKVDSEWHFHEQCTEGKGASTEKRNAGPLIQLDKTSTQPKLIFDLDSSNRKMSWGEDRLSTFQPKMVWDETYEPMIIYSHLYRGGNHYQFYFRFLEYVKNNEEEIKNWAEELDKKIEQDSYNIVLAPLNMSNSLFLKLVIDNVFSSSLRLLHIPVDETYKEEVRTRFSYIAEEYKKIKTLNASAKINFYYVDDSIVTGHTLNRARMFLRMLLDESEIEYNEIKIFRKVFLLINRSSYDTLNTFVDDPQENVHAFANIGIPSYNTSSDYCPACEVRDRFELLRKRSNTEAMRKEFDRLCYKHMKRTPKEYLAWQDKEICENPSYFAWLRLFLYHWDPTLEKNREDVPHIKFIKDEVLAYLNERFDKDDLVSLTVEDEESKERRARFIDTITKLTIGDIVKGKSDSYKMKFVNLMKYLIEQRAYRRFKAMSKAYESLLKPFPDARCREAREAIVRDRIIALIEQEFETVKDIESPKAKFYEKAEILTSYIKVISREQLSNYYTIRKVIIEVMKDILSVVVENKAEKDLARVVGFLRFPKFSGRTADNNLCAALQLQIYFTIIHRLAVLQCEDVFEKENIEQIIKHYKAVYNKYFFLKSNEKEKYDGYAESDKIDLLLMTCVPSFESLVEKYVASIKVAGMMNKNELPDYLCLFNGTGDSQDKQNGK